MKTLLLILALTLSGFAAEPEVALRGLARMQEEHQAIRDQKDERRRQRTEIIATVVFGAIVVGAGFEVLGKIRSRRKRSPG